MKRVAAGAHLSIPWILKLRNAQMINRLLPELQLPPLVRTLGTIFLQFGSFGLKRASSGGGVWKAQPQ